MTSNDRAQFWTNRLVVRAFAIESVLLLLWLVPVAGNRPSIFWSGPLIQAAMAKSTSTKAVSSQSAQNPKLIELEQRLFFRDFSSEDENSRLNRIERQVFGETSTGAT